MSLRARSTLRRRAIDGLWARDVANAPQYRERLESELEVFARNDWTGEVLFLAETSAPFVVSPASVVAWSLGLSPIDPVRAGLDAFHLTWASRLEHCAARRLPSDIFEDVVNRVALDRPFPVWSGLANAYHLGLVPGPWPEWAVNTRGLLVYRSQALERLVQAEAVDQTNARRFVFDRPEDAAAILGVDVDVVRALCRREKMEELAFRHFGTPADVRRLTRLRD